MSSYRKYLPPYPFPSPPATRAGCENLPRPCPALACRYHIGSESSKTGGVKVRTLAANELSCLFDVLQLHPHGMNCEEVAATGIANSKQRVDQIEEKALHKLSASGEAAQLYHDSD